MDSHTHSHVHDMTEKKLSHYINQAADICAERKVRFTTLRRQVLSLILAAKKPIGAYELMAQLQQKNEANKPIAPPTVYRSLDFLLQQGFIHRLTSINAFIACCHPKEPHEAAFIICKTCNAVQEFAKEPLFKELSQIIEKDGFTSEQMVVEVMGVCRQCKDDLG